MNESDEEEYTYEDDDEEYDEVEYGEDEMSKEDGDSKRGEPSRDRSSSMSGVMPTDGSFIIKSMDDVVPYMTKMTTEVSSLLDVDADQAQVLLISFLWDKERLLDRFFSDSEKLFLECGLNLYHGDISKSCLPPGGRGGGAEGGGDVQNFMAADTKDSIRIARSSASSSSKASMADGQSRSKRLRSSNDAKSYCVSDAKGDKGRDEGTGAKNSNSTFKCRICYDDCLSTDDFFRLGCGHGFCYVCYSEYIVRQVGDGPSCIYMPCPEHKCNQIIPRTVISRLIGNDTEILEKYELYVRRNFIESNKKYRYCPGAGCDKVFVGSGVTNVRCACDHNFCFRCGDDAHEPSSCAHLEAWTIKCSNESETANWILVNTKKCPHCTSRIEKNQGCNHINCKVCKHEFCWICMGAWSEHGQGTGGYYKCNRYDGKEISDESNEADRAKADLERYLHYYQRYHGHDHSLKFANELRADADCRMVESQEVHQSSWLEVQFLKQAAEQVIECRRLLKYTYVLGFFLEDKTPEKQLFEHHQEMLEKNTERLHECTEQKVLDIDRSQVINLTRVTEKFMASLMESMNGGIIQGAEGTSQMLVVDNGDHN